jgi:Tfp pilus assembly protein PilE
MLIHAGGMRAAKPRGGRATRGRQSGVSFVELLTAVAIAGILGIVIYTFIVFSSGTVRRITAMQLMQQESSVITEVFMRDVRNGSYVCVGSTPLPPEFDTSGITNITIRGTDSTGADSVILVSLTIAGEKFIRATNNTDSTMLTSSLWANPDRPNCFKVFQNGDHVEFSLNLQRTSGDDTLFLANIVGDVRCKN